MKCEYCEREIPDGAGFCPVCLCLIEDTPEALAAQTRALAARSQDVPVEIAEEEVEPSGEGPHTGFFRLGIFVLIAGLMGIIALICLFIAYERSLAPALVMLAIYTVSFVVVVGVLFGLDEHHLRLNALESRLDALEAENQSLREQLK